MWKPEAAEGASASPDNAVGSSSRSSNCWTPHYTPAVIKNNDSRRSSQTSEELSISCRVITLFQTGQNCSCVAVKCVFVQKEHLQIPWKHFTEELPGTARSPGLLIQKIKSENIIFNKGCNWFEKVGGHKWGKRFLGLNPISWIYIRLGTTGIRQKPWNIVFSAWSD